MCLGLCNVAVSAPVAEDLSSGGSPDLPVIRTLFLDRAAPHGGTWCRALARAGTATLNMGEPKLAVLPGMSGKVGIRPARSAGCWATCCGRRCAPKRPFAIGEATAGLTFAAARLVAQPGACDMSRCTTAIRTPGFQRVA